MCPIGKSPPIPPGWGMGFSGSHPAAGASVRRAPLMEKDCPLSEIRSIWNDLTISDAELHSTLNVLLKIPEVSGSPGVRSIVEGVLDKLLLTSGVDLEVASARISANGRRGQVTLQDCPHLILRNLWNNYEVPGVVVRIFLSKILEKCKPAAGHPLSQNFKTFAPLLARLITAMGQANVSDDDTGNYPKFAAFEDELAAGFPDVKAGPPSIGDDEFEAALEAIGGAPWDETDIYTPPGVRVGPTRAFPNHPIVIIPSDREIEEKAHREFHIKLDEGRVLIARANRIVELIARGEHEGDEFKKLATGDFSGRVAAFTETGIAKMRKKVEDIYDVSLAPSTPSQTKTELKRCISEAKWMEIILGSINRPVLAALRLGPDAVKSVAASFASAREIDKGPVEFTVTAAEAMAGRLEIVLNWLSANAIVSDATPLARHREAVQALKSAESAADSARQFQFSNEIERTREKIEDAFIDALPMTLSGTVTPELNALDHAMGAIIDSRPPPSSLSDVHSQFAKALVSAGRAADSLKEKLVSEKTGLISGSDTGFEVLSSLADGRDTLKKEIESRRIAITREHIRGMLRNIVGKKDWKENWRALAMQGISDTIAFLNAIGGRFHSGGIAVEKRVPARPSSLVLKKTPDVRERLVPDHVGDTLNDCESAMEAVLLWFCGEGQAPATFTFNPLIENLARYLTSRDSAENEALRAELCGLYDAACLTRDAIARIHQAFDGNPRLLLGKNPLPHRVTAEIALCLIGTGERNGYIAEIREILGIGEGASAPKGTSGAAASGAKRGTRSSVPVPMLSVLYEMRTRLESIKRDMQQKKSPGAYDLEMAMRHKNAIRDRIGNYIGQPVWFALVQVAGMLDEMERATGNIPNFVRLLNQLISNKTGSERGALQTAIDLLEGGAGGARGGSMAGGDPPAAPQNAGSTWNDLAPLLSGAHVALLGAGRSVDVYAGMPVENFALVPTQLGQFCLPGFLTPPIMNSAMVGFLQPVI